MSTRSFSFNIALILVLFIVFDLYIYTGLRKSISKSKWYRSLRMAYLLGVTLFYTGFFIMYSNFVERPLEVSFLENLFIGFFFAFFVFKLVLLIFFLAEDLFRVSTYLIIFTRSFFGHSSNRSSFPGRRTFIRQTGLFLAALPFGSMLYGVAKGKYNFRLSRQTLAFKNLPSSFNGFKIIHISDIHSGSFDNRDAVVEGINLINNQEADLILFTGDLVNNDSREVEPYMEELKKLRAKEGVYSVLGNHDYGDYKKWESAEAKAHNMELMYQFQKEIGFNLLNNSNASLERSGDKIGIYGVENWGNPPFPQRGDLDLALKGLEDVDFKILMSHDPTHWDKVISSYSTKFDLTLAGHTHGMQFGVEIPGFKWSPSKYIYPQWAGLYEKAERLLYVNRGFGFLGFPGRVGIWPEITLIELVKET